MHYIKWLLCKLSRHQVLCGWIASAMLHICLYKLSIIILTRCTFSIYVFYMCMSTLCRWWLAYVNEVLRINFSVGVCEFYLNWVQYWARTAFFLCFCLCETIGNGVSNGFRWFYWLFFIVFQYIRYNSTSVLRK